MNALSDALLRKRIQDLATKIDVENLRQEMKGEFALVRQEMKSDSSLLRQEMKNIDARLDGHLTLIKWMLGILIPAVLAIVIRIFFFPVR